MHRKSFDFYRCPDTRAHRVSLEAALVLNETSFEHKACYSTAGLLTDKPRLLEVREACGFLASECGDYFW